MCGGGGGGRERERENVHCTIMCCASTQTHSEHYTAENCMVAKYVVNFPMLVGTLFKHVVYQGPVSLLSCVLLLHMSCSAPCFSHPSLLTSCCRGQTGQSAEDIEWDQVEKERELKKAEVERARQELETRRRIEARLKAKQEAEAKSKGEGCGCGWVWVGGCGCVSG